MKGGDRERGKQKPKVYYRPMSHRDCGRMILRGMREGVWAQSWLEADQEEGAKLLGCVSQGSAEKLNQSDPCAC